MVVVLAVCGLAEHSIENRHIYLLYIAYVAACLPEMNDFATSALLFENHTELEQQKVYR